MSSIFHFNMKILSDIQNHYYTSKILFDMLQKPDASFYNVQNT